MRCVLREVQDEDLEVLFEQWADPVAAQMAAFTAPGHMEREAFERRWARLRADRTVLNRAIVVDGEVTGTIGSWGEPHEREITYWIGRRYWGRGIATCALHAFLAVDPTRPLHARVAYDNVASRRVLEKCGFRVIGSDRGYAEARSSEIEEFVLQLVDDEPVVIREEQPDDYDAIRHVYAEAFRRPRFRSPQKPDSIPPEVGIFEALHEAGDAIPELSFTALVEGVAVGHVTASRATVNTDPVVAVGPIGVLPAHQGTGIGSGLMDALLAAADASNIPLVVLLGEPQYYRRFGFRPAEELGVTPPEPEWGDAFQARPSTAYTGSIAGQFQYAPAFSSS